MYCDLWPYVWLVFKSGFLSRAGYDGTRTVSIYNYEFETQSKTTQNIFLISRPILNGVLGQRELGLARNDVITRGYQVQCLLCLFTCELLSLGLLNNH